MTLHPETLPENTLNVFVRLKGMIKTDRFVLAGGTALALQLGHRISEDLDFFTSRRFSSEELFQKIKRRKLSPVVLQEGKGTLTVLAEGVKLSFFHYDYPFQEKPVVFEGIPIADVVDIASMKIIAINQRGAKRDFVDLYFILQTFPFWKIAGNLVQRYGAERIHPVQTGKSLVYFADAENDPEPRYCSKERPEWHRVKKFFQSRCKQFTLDLQQAVS